MMQSVFVWTVGDVIGLGLIAIAVVCAVVLGIYVQIKEWVKKGK